MSNPQSYFNSFLFFLSSLSFSQFPYDYFFYVDSFPILPSDKIYDRPRQSMLTTTSRANLRCKQQTKNKKQAHPATMQNLNWTSKKTKHCVRFGYGSLKMAPLHKERIIDEVIAIVDSSTNRNPNALMN